MNDASIEQLKDGKSVAEDVIAKSFLKSSRPIKPLLVQQSVIFVTDVFVLEPIHGLLRLSHPSTRKVVYMTPIITGLLL